GSGLSLPVDDSLVSGNKLVRCHTGIFFYGDDCDFHNNRMLKSENVAFNMGAGSEGNLICGNVAKKSGWLDLEMHASPMDNDFIDNQFRTIGP
ncbi:MAG: hypothetical protein GY953_56455, partial [bacterium]|nr:hypothetical protein [bacterium]